MPDFCSFIDDENWKSDVFPRVYFITYARVKPGSHLS